MTPNPRAPSSRGVVIHRPRGVTVRFASDAEADAWLLALRVSARRGRGRERARRNKGRAGSGGRRRGEEARAAVALTTTAAEGDSEGDWCGWSKTLGQKLAGCVDCDAFLVRFSKT